MNSPACKENQIVITAIGRDHPGLVNQLSKVIHDLNCNIVDSRLSVLGGSFAVIMVIAGSWDMIAKLENILKTTAKEIELTLQLHHLSSRKAQIGFMPYLVE